ncbi:MAG TPA: hypothetical protein VMF12_15500 [Xanthobacteraceae bacterium]|nr:hypothetical protein [Xanthobacteraceae bacterium]
MKDSAEKFNLAGSLKPRGRCAVAMLWLAAVALLPAAAGAQTALPSALAGTSPAPAAPAPTAPQAVAPAAPSAPQGRGLFPLQPPPPDRPGFIYAFGHWWDSARGKIDDLTKQSDKGAETATQDAVHGAAEATQGAAAATQDAVRNAAEATKKAATTLFHLPGMRVIEVHERCAIAPNGAPDCGMAATKACRAKGFGDGHPINVQSAENCPPSVWMSGREPAAGECPEETVVLMAACQ